MNLTQEQLDWIVSEVVRRLKNGAAESVADTAATLTLAERLVTLETLRNRLDGVSKIRVTARAIVTPAARDLLKERQVQLLRQ